MRSSRGEIVALLGPSGSGKSTLLQAVGLLEGGFEGSIRLQGEEAADLDDEGRTRLRRELLGFVYQFHHLLPEFNARRKRRSAATRAGRRAAAARGRARTAARPLGLSKRLDHRPAKLSGGEQQRVAVARALANKPPLVLADEPTGNLDEHTADAVFGEFLELVRGEGSAALVATHNERLAARWTALCGCTKDGSNRWSRSGRATFRRPAASSTRPVALIGGLVWSCCSWSLISRPAESGPGQADRQRSCTSKRAGADPEKRCASKATYDLIKRDLFRRAAQLRGSDQAAFDQLAAYAVAADGKSGHGERG